MPIIGIIASKSDSNFIRNEILKNSSNKYEIININKESIQNLKNIRFDIIAITEDTENLMEKSKYLEEALNKTKYLIINSDTIKMNKNENVNTITYGLKHDSDITISSIKQENVFICIQKKLTNINGFIIEEQEFNIEMNKNCLRKIYNSMVVFIILAIYGEFLEKI